METLEQHMRRYEAEMALRMLENEIEDLQRTERRLAKLGVSADIWYAEVLRWRRLEAIKNHLAAALDAR